MKARFFLLLVAAATAASAQPSFEAPPPSRRPEPYADTRRQEYLRRVDEILHWRVGASHGQDGQMDMAAIAVNLVLHQNIDLCSRRVIEMMKSPGSGPFWMFPSVCVAFTGRDQLSPEARVAIRNAWRTTYQIRGDTENHWAMYYISLYLMSELYPNEPADTWFNGKSSAENLAESRSYLIHWIDLTTARGEAEYDPTQYIGEYAIPFLFLSTWAQDPAMRARGHMMLDWLFAQLAENTLDGVLCGANARTDEGSVVERWNGLSSFFSWLLFGNTPPPAGYGGWGVYFATVARNYHLPAVIYRIATDRPGSYLQRELERSRRRWRYSDVLSAPIYKTTYMTRDYAVGSYQGGVSDPIQTHVWDVTWNVPDPRGVHNTMFSLHPYASNHVLQMYFTAYPDTMVQEVTQEGKPSYDSPDKILGCSPYEQVFQDRDTIIALYDIRPGTHFPQVNGFFSKDLADVTEDPSGWIFARGGNAYLAYRPLAPYHWQPYLHYNGGWAKEKKAIGGRLLVSPHLRNGTIVQAASASEFSSFAAFQAAIRALPLTFTLDPVPTVRMTTLRGRPVSVTYGRTPEVAGKPVDYADWKLFQGPYLNADAGSHRLTITHGRLQRVLDFNTLTIADSVKPGA
ncbi:MAG TPA: hypothetical protein VHE61_19420 [Opitutaceae bacterium]|nr:hypothetical protein [Opitutaceae bacterium]